MARNRVERRLLVVELYVNRTGSAAADLVHRRDIGVAQFGRSLDVHAALVPAGDMSRIGERDPGIFLQDLFDRDPEPCGADRDILEPAVLQLSGAVVFTPDRSRFGPRTRRTR